jgi:3-deoxy-D-manno-octulosonate 8-phosphate phosphatase (KDO 8-P phosphatase)
MTELMDQPGFRDRARNIEILAIDFDGVMTDNRVYVFEDGREAVVCSRLEGYGLRRAAAAGVYCFILSTEDNPVVSRRAKKLNLDCIQGSADKVASFEAVLKQCNLSFAQAAFIGNDVNDAELLKRVALPVIVADAHSSVHALTPFRTLHKGGDGAVRELCDAISASRNG